MARTKPVETEAVVEDQVTEDEAIVEDEDEVSEMDQATADFLERVSKSVGEETARQRLERVKRESAEFIKGLKETVKAADADAKNKVVTDLLQPEFEKLVAAAEEFTGLTVRRLSLRYTHGKDEAPEYKISHTINKARGSETSNDSDEETETVEETEVKTADKA